MRTDSEARILPSPEIRFGLADLDPELAKDLWSSIEMGIAAGAALEGGGGPEAHFRAAVQRSARAIAREARAPLLRSFLTAGPYFDGGGVPKDRVAEFQSDQDVAATIRFIHASVISAFQGALAELLAIGPLCDLAMQVAGERKPRLFAGDTVRALGRKGRSFAKAADFHLFDQPEANSDSRVRLLGVAEVKSYAVPPERLGAQLDRHLSRAQLGLEISGRVVRGARLEIGETTARPLRIVVEPAKWRLSREFRFEETEGRRRLVPGRTSPPETSAKVEQTGERDWRIELRWSKEALAAEAYGLTFAYLADLGSLLYESERPAGWDELSPEEAGENAAKMMPYYAILRADSPDAASRAVALYNSYGFGYALGAHFFDQYRRREMLWFDDFEEIAAKGYASRPERIIEEEEGRDRRVIPARRCRFR